jgi:hypothetical protein
MLRIRQFGYLQSCLIFMVILGRLNDSSTNSLVSEKDFVSAKALFALWQSASQYLSGNLCSRFLLCLVHGSVGYWYGECDRD